MYVFGSGVLIGTDSSGVSVNFGLAQEVTLSVAQTTKSLYGQNNFPVAIGAGTRKLTGKAKLASLSGVAMGRLFFGVAPSVGTTQTQFGEAGSVPASTPWTVTVVNSANWTADQGVVYAATGLPMKKVASGPTIGQYSVAAGVYTFATADASAAVLISYQYSAAAVGQSVSVNTALIGPTISFSANLFAADPTTGKQFSLFLNNCVAQKLDFGTKLEDFVMPEMDFECYANAAGQVCKFNFGDTA
jgi:hypothetical protein